MNQRLWHRVMGGALAAVLIPAALCAQAIEQKIDFYLDGKVGAETVKKGSYKISFPDADQGTLEIKVGKKSISVPFTRRQNDDEASVDRMTYRNNPDGTRSIATITPRGRKFTIVLQ